MVRGLVEGGTNVLSTVPMGSCRLCMRCWTVFDQPHSLWSNSEDNKSSTTAVERSVLFTCSRNAYHIERVLPFLFLTLPGGPNCCNLKGPTRHRASWQVRHWIIM
ncbi:hypothetical protein AVEN_63248-1 [Araneus ventricosus]|uniref:Uncharacterized protein n=1 Tax=Araneus ventricosus TaxID=182803 RepID=A0A4Y2B1I1_ARAVE|nr:hypothetical protein AVEN_63248-1 [Araneus ventricosus]